MFVPDEEFIVHQNQLLAGMQYQNDGCGEHLFFLQLSLKNAVNHIALSAMNF